MTLHTDPKKVAKQILPAGHIGYSYDPNRFDWSKRHGHAGGRMIERAIDKAKALGFKDGTWDNFNSPDGSVMGSKSTMYHPDGWELSYYSSYGCVAYDNSFSMTLKKVVRTAVPA